MRGLGSGGPGTFHFHFPTQGQLSRTAYGPEELMGIFLSRGMCKQMTGPGGVACGFLVDQQLQGVTPGTAICSPPPLHLSQPGSPTQSGIQKIQVQGRGPWGKGQSDREPTFCGAHSRPLRLSGSGLMTQGLRGLNCLGVIP